MINEDKRLRKEIEASEKDIMGSFPVLFRKMKYVTASVGWHGIIYDMCAQITKLIEEECQDLPEEDLPYVADIKEKYGSLRVALYNATDNMDSVVSQAERLSETACELCGRKSEIKGQGWLVNRCERCE